MLDYKLIEALAMVVQEGGFDKAAQVLHLTQSAVSQRVKLLEEQTGQILLARMSPPRATPAGKRMLKHFLQVKRLEDDMLESMIPSSDDGFVSLAVGVNADSLATWFVEAIRPFLEREKVLLDLRAADQDETHRFLRDGEVLGCISTLDQPIQGCRVDYLGRMAYRLFASHDFAKRWFPDGLTLEAVRRAPVLNFDRMDNFYIKAFQQVFGEVPSDPPMHYFPSTEKFCDFIALGFAYGALTDHHSAPWVKAGKLIDLAPSLQFSVKLYWHRWNIHSRLLEKLSHCLITRTGALLKR